MYSSSQVMPPCGSLSPGKAQFHSRNLFAIIVLSGDCGPCARSSPCASGEGATPVGGYHGAAFDSALLAGMLPAWLASWRVLACNLRASMSFIFSFRRWLLSVIASRRNE